MIVALRFNSPLEGNDRISALHCLKSDKRTQKGEPVWSYFGLMVFIRDGHSRRYLTPTEIDFTDLPPNPGGFQEIEVEPSSPKDVTQKVKTLWFE